jgi:hypothetical protein
LADTVALNLGKNPKGRIEMDFGITLPTPADSWKTVKRAEDAGFTLGLS